MKRFFFTVFIALCVIGLSAETIRYMYVRQTNGIVNKVAVDKIESINFGIETTNEDLVLNGHEYVDLGLLSGTLWATCNVGAESPEDYGDYFSWGETTPKSSYSSDNYKWSGDDSDYYNDWGMTKYNRTDGLSTLEASDDAATANWGGSWRMPTKEESYELIQKCTWIWTTLNGVDGYEVKGPNGNSIFLPAAGHCSPELYAAGTMGFYWSSTIGINLPNTAYQIRFSYTEYALKADYSFRECGLPVRPVCVLK